MVAAEASSFLASWFSDGRPRPALRLMAGGVAAVLAVTLGVGVGVSPVAAASAAVATAVAPKAAKVVSRPDVVSAAVTARAQGSRVEVESERSATSTTWVNPDGTSTTEQHAGPIRFRDAAGSWRDVDLELAEQADGSVAPKGHPGGLRLSGPSKTASLAAPTATENDVVSTDEGKGGTKGVSLVWKGRLGKPTLAGNRATYADVQPGVDLVVDVLRTGYEQFLVVKTPAALAGLSGGGSPVAWSMPVKTRGLNARTDTDGSVSFVDAKNVVASRLAAPKAWDATVDPNSGEHTSTAPVKLSVAQKGKGNAVVTLTPDQVWLADPARVFPITIDPTYASANVTASFDTFVSKAYPTATYSTSTELKVGTYNGGVDAVRSFLSFPLASIKGKQIVSASLSLYEYHSWSCTARPFYVYNAYAANSSTNWSNQPAAPTNYGSLNTAKGYSSSCAAGRVSVPVTSLVSSWSGSSATSGPIRLHASETDNYGWKKFYSLESSQDPYITFTYNRKPNAATAPTLQAPPATSFTPLGSTVPMLFTTDSTPQFSSKATDPDANTVAMWTEVHTSTTTSASTLKASCPTAFVASGATASCSPTTALADSTLYYARTAVKDQLGLWNGTWSPWTAFYTSWSTPPVPVISCPAPYLNASWQDQPPTADITCTVTAAGVSGNYATPGYLDLTVDGVAKARVKIVVSNDPNVAKTTVVVPKALAGGHTIKAVSVARTLKVSAASTYSFGWGQSGLSQPAPPPAARVTTTGSINIAAAGPPKGTSIVPTAKVRWRIAGSSDDELVGWNDAASAPLTVVDNAAAGVTVTGSWNTKSETADAFLDSDPATAGVQPTVLNERVPVLLDVQVCLTYSTSGTQCTWSATKVSVLRVPHAFGNGFPTAAAGPGQVALFTGEFNASATDASVPGYTGTISLSRSHSTYSNAPSVSTDAVTSVFGPGWTASLEGNGAGLGGLQAVDSTRVDGTIAFVNQDGTALVYLAPCGTGCSAPRRTTANLTPGTYASVDHDTALSGTALTVSGTGAGTALTLTEDDGTKSTFTPGSAGQAPTATAAGVFAPETVVEPGSLTTSYTRDTTTGRVTRILAPTPPGTVAATGRAVSCPNGLAAGMDKGCRALRITYGTGIDGTPAGQVQQVSADLYNPAILTTKDCAGAALTVPVGMGSMPIACYTYDTSSKRLTGVKDPRTDLETTYAYGSANQLAEVTVAGQAPFTLVYSTLEQRLKLTGITRPQAAPLSGTASLARIVYGVPLSGTDLPTLTASDTTAWRQARPATFAAAVFGADYTGAVTQSGPANTADWAYADLSYTDAQGYKTNTASYGAGDWQRTSTDYDANGNVLRELSAGALSEITSQALDPGQADLYATIMKYNEAGTLVTDKWGPVRNAAMTDGTITAVRPHTRTQYDQGAPMLNNSTTNPETGEPYMLPTTVTVTSADGGGTDIAGETVSTTVNNYDASLPGSADGWALGTATKVTTGGVPTTIGLDDAGRTIETRQPLSNGADAGTTLTMHYTADGSAAADGCDAKPEWAGLPCLTMDKSAPSEAGIPVENTSAYDVWLKPITVVSSRGGATLTTTTTGDSAGRTVQIATTGTLPGSLGRPTMYLHYDPSTGRNDYTGPAFKPSGNLAALERTVVSDSWGRTVLNRSENGDATATAYQEDGRVKTISDPTGLTEFTWDGADALGKTEHRSALTKLTVTRGGASGHLTYAGAYNAVGALTVQKMPGGVTQNIEHDLTGELTGLSYSGQVIPVTGQDAGGAPTYGSPTTGTWLAWTQVNDVIGRVRSDYTPVGAAFDATSSGVTDPDQIVAPVGEAIPYDRAYTYDAVGRIAQVRDRTASATGVTLDPNVAPTADSPCTQRDYTWDANSRRTAMKTTTHADGDCAGQGSSATSSSSFDAADRLTTAGNTYDEFGRQTVIAASDAPISSNGDITLAYFNDDTLRQITQGEMTTTYERDSLGRVNGEVTTRGPIEERRVSRHYVDQSGDARWTVETGAGGSITRRQTPSISAAAAGYVLSSGDAVLTLSNLHGDAVTSFEIPAGIDESAPATSISRWSDYDEFGLMRGGASDEPGVPGVGWLGEQSRTAGSETAGLTLMGARVYNPVTGGFTSIDPEPGGTANNYVYATDPINTHDVSGCRVCTFHWWGSNVYRTRLSNSAWAYSPWYTKRYSHWWDDFSVGLYIVFWKERWRERYEYDRLCQKWGNRSGKVTVTYTTKFVRQYQDWQRYRLRFTSWTWDEKSIWWTVYSHSWVTKSYIYRE